MTIDQFSADDHSQSEDTKEGAPTNSFNQSDNSGSSEGSGLSQEKLQEILKRDKHAQEHIERLETERRQDREKLEKYERELQEAATYKDLIERMQENNAREHSNEEPTARIADVDELVSAAEKRVMDSLTTREREQKETDNFTRAVEDLKGTFGDEDKVVEAVAKKAKELGLPLEEMDRLAKTSPTALVTLVKGNTTRNSNVPTDSGNTTSVASQTGQDNLEKFEQVKKENQRLFYSPGFQAQYNKAILDKANMERERRGMPTL